MGRWTSSPPLEDFLASVLDSASSRFWRLSTGQSLAFLEMFLTSNLTLIISFKFLFQLCSGRRAEQASGWIIMVNASVFTLSNHSMESRHMGLPRGVCPLKSTSQDGSPMMGGSHDGSPMMGGGI